MYCGPSTLPWARLICTRFVEVEFNLAHEHEWWTRTFNGMGWKGLNSVRFREYIYLVGIIWDLHTLSWVPVEEEKTIQRAWNRTNVLRSGRVFPCNNLWAEVYDRFRRRASPKDFWTKVVKVDCLSVVSRSVTCLSSARTRTMHQGPMAKDPVAVLRESNHRGVPLTCPMMREWFGTQ